VPSLLPAEGLEQQKPAGDGLAMMMGSARRTNRSAVPPGWCAEAGPPSIAAQMFTLVPGDGNFLTLILAALFLACQRS
jgi:hypothetical protein